jgi:WD40 repeat protein
MQAVFDSDARRVATVGAGGEVKVWLLRASAPKNIGPLAMVSQDGSTYVTVSSNELRFWNATNDQALTPALTLPGAVAKGVANQDGSRVVVQMQGEPPPLAVLQTVSREGLLPSVVLNDAKFWVVNSTGTRLLSRDDRVLRGWNLDTGEEVFETPALPMKPNVAAFAPNGRSVAVASGNSKRILVLDADTGLLRRELDMAAGVQSLAFSPDSQRLAASEVEGAPFNPGHVRLWDLPSGALIGRPMVHSDAVKGALFSHDGRSIVTYGTDNRAAVWHTADTKPVMDPIFLTTYVESAAFSADDRWLVTASKRQVQVWDARTGQAVTPPFSDAVPFHRAGFCAGGRRVWAATRRGVLLWDLPQATGTPDELMALADHLGTTVPATLSWNTNALTATQLEERCAQERRAATATLPAWRTSQIDHAEARGDWFAAQFHLEKLLQTTPNDADLRRRLAAAREQLKAPAP